MLRYPPTRIALDITELEYALRKLASNKPTQYDIRQQLRLYREPDETLAPYPTPATSPPPKHINPGNGDSSSTASHQFRTPTHPPEDLAQATNVQDQAMVKWLTCALSTLELTLVPARP
jgi:hypothetical protein